jgi:hypothetical protein
VHILATLVVQVGQEQTDQWWILELTSADGDVLALELPTVELGWSLAKSCQALTALHRGHRAMALISTLPWQ